MSPDGRNFRLSFRWSHRSLQNERFDDAGTYGMAVIRGESASRDCNLAAHVTGWLRSTLLKADTERLRDTVAGKEGQEPVSTSDAEIRHVKETRAYFMPRRFIFSSSTRSDCTRRSSWSWAWSRKVSVVTGARLCA